MSKTFVIADQHFFHQNVMVYESRPFKDIFDMNDSMVRRWNSVISRADKVYALGDVSFGRKPETQEIIESLNGYKVLVMGNHDKGRSAKNFWLDAGFQEVIRHPILIDDNIILSHEPQESLWSIKQIKNIYGHVHGNWGYKTITENTACVSVERWNYTPVNMETLKLLMKLQEDGHSGMEKYNQLLSQLSQRSFNQAVKVQSQTSRR